MPTSSNPFHLLQSWRDFHEPTSTVNCMKFSCSGHLLAVAGSDSSIILFKTIDGTPVHILHLAPRIQAVCLLWTPEDELIVSSTDGLVASLQFQEFYDFQPRRLDWVPFFFPSVVTTMDYFGPTQSLVLTFSGCIEVWCRATGDWRLKNQLLPQTAGQNVSSVAFMSKKRVLIIYEQNGGRIWDYSKKKKHDSLTQLPGSLAQSKAPIECIAFGDATRFIATATSKQTLVHHLDETIDSIHSSEISRLRHPSDRKTDLSLGFVIMGGKAHLLITGNGKAVLKPASEMGLSNTKNFLVFPLDGSVAALTTFSGNDAQHTAFATYDGAGNGITVWSTASGNTKTWTLGDTRLPQSFLVRMMGSRLRLLRVPGYRYVLYTGRAWSTMRTSTVRVPWVNKTIWLPKLSARELRLTLFGVILSVVVASVAYESPASLDAGVSSDNHSFIFLARLGARRFLRRGSDYVVGIFLSAFWMLRTFCEYVIDNMRLAVVGAYMLFTWIWTATMFTFYVAWYAARSLIWAGAELGCNNFTDFREACEYLQASQMRRDDPEYTPVPK